MWNAMAQCDDMFGHMAWILKSLKNIVYDH
jgi:hypothetical protein